jgi:hypothetical protein
MVGGDHLINTNVGKTLLRIRSPHSHDVLCGRGGGINSHVGNRVFRDWIADRRLDYNLASTKADKARVARQVMNKIIRQHPPGRFLQRDPNAGVGSWWIEIPEEKALAKISQALREGAPNIRAQHQYSEGSPVRGSWNESPTQTVTPILAPAQSMLIPPPLVSNADFEESFIRPYKKAKQESDDAPLLVSSCDAIKDHSSVDSARVVSPVMTAVPLKRDFFDEALWCLDGLVPEEFINPFENEEGAIQLHLQSLELRNLEIPSLSNGPSATESIMT